MPPKKRKVAFEKKEEDSISDNEDDVDISVNGNGSGTTLASSSRRVKQKEIAERRAAFFARADKSDESVSVSSTPTGLLPANRKGGNDDAAESWPGPFATAHAMIEKREEAKRRREEAIAQKESGVASTSSFNGEEFVLDAYDLETQNLTWTPQIIDISKKRNSRTAIQHTPRTRNSGPLSSLSQLCVNLIVEHFDNVESLEGIQDQGRESIACQLARQRKLNATAALLVSSHMSDSIYLPECSALEVEDVMQIVEKLTGIPMKDLQNEIDEESEEEEGSSSSSHTTKRKANSKSSKDTQKADKIKDIIYPIAERTEEDGISKSLRVLYLKNCGHCFSDRAAAATVNHIGSLEMLTLTGCYQLSDEALCKMLDTCSKSLRSLDISCDSRLGLRGMTAIASLAELTSLTLDNSTHLTDADILCLFSGDAALLNNTSSSSSASSSSKQNNPLPMLEQLSLNGLCRITDASCVGLLSTHGKRLTSLSLSGCVSLTDEVLIAIRSHCYQLKHLDLSNLGHAVTTAALLGLFVMNPQHENNDELPLSTEEPNINDDRYSIDHFRQNQNSANEIERTVGRLQSVSLRGTLSTTDDVIVLISESSGSSLQNIDINGCFRLGDRAAAALWLRCHASLRTLDVSFVRGISENAMGVLVDRCEVLQTLSVWGCTQLTARFFEGHSKHDLHVSGRMVA